MQRLVIGTYTHPKGHAPGACGRGIVSARFDAGTGALEIDATCDAVADPAYLAVVGGDRVFAVSECDGPGGVAAFRLADDGAVSLEMCRPLEGRAHCHLCYHDGRLYVAAYESGTLSASTVEGVLIGPGRVTQYAGSGPDAARQTRSHAHHVAISPDGAWLYVCDLGADRIWCHRADAEPGAPCHGFATPAGAGPRHLCFHPRRACVYVICELSGDLLLCDYDATTGALRLRDRQSTLNAAHRGAAASAAIRMHPTGEAVYVSNRSDDSITSFPLHEDGSLGEAVWTPCGGRNPRDMAVDPSGAWLLVAHQDGNTIAVCPLGADRVPAPAQTRTYACETPVCLLFV